MSVLHHGDCLDLLAGMGDASAQLVLTSPPYNIGKEYEKVKDLDAYLEEQRPVIEQCARILTDTGSLVWQVGNYVNAKTKEVIPLDALYWPLLKDAGLISRGRIVWTFNHGLHASKRFSGRHETLLWFSKSSDYVFNLDEVRVPQLYPGKKHFKGPRKGELSGNPLGKNPGDVWQITNVKHNHPEKNAHPCSYPMDLASRCILAMTNPGDTVVDPYGGSGTTVVAAEKHGRIGVMAEIHEPYIEIAKSRLAGVLV